MKVRATLTRVSQQLALLMRSPALALWALYILLVPIYVFRSGLPQPGDLLIFILFPAVWVVWDQRLDATALTSLQALLRMIGWFTLVNVVWAAALGRLGLWGKETFLLTPLFYVYNGVVFFITLVLQRRFGAHFVSLTLHTLLVAVVMQVLISFVYSRGGSRGAVLFNQANQLGFYALLTANAFALARKELGFGAIKTLIGQMACLYLSILSASKAALGGTLLLVAVASLRSPRMVVAFCAVALLAVAYTPLGDVADQARHRIATDESFGFFEERGYDRIINHKEHWFLGSGEGGYDRFRETTVIGAHELHSSIGTVFFCYGLVGLMLFVIFLYRVVEGSSWRMALMLVPSLSFGLTHQGLRFSLLWVLFALFVAIKRPSLTAPASGASPGGAS